MLHIRFATFIAAVGLLLSASQVGLAEACPFCSASSQTLSEEMATMDVVVIAKLVEPPAKPDAKSDPNEIPKAKFDISHVLKGEKLLGDQKKLEAVYYGEAAKGKSFLVMAISARKLEWTTPLVITDRTQNYLKELPKLPKDGVERLVFFQRHLEDKDDLLARDAYDEFAKAPYDVVKALKPKMDHAQLLAWIKDDTLPASRRRLYLTMLGICGTAEDIPMLETMLASDDRKVRSGLDAMIACYLNLKGAEGMPLIEDLFLKNPKSEYPDMFSTLMALRFQISDGHKVPKARIVEAFRHLLARPSLADLVIPDLWRLEDWASMDQLVHLFKTADDKSSWVKVPVINFMRACPLPKAKEHLKEFEELDPEAVRRATTFFPVIPSADATSNKASWLPRNRKLCVPHSIWKC